MIQKTLTAFLNIFRFHKGKIGIFLVCLVVFTLLLFPYNDLGDMVSGKIIEATGGTVSLQFEEMGVSLFPQLGVKFIKVYLDSPFLPPLTVESLALAPSVLGLLTFKPGIKARATGFFDGRISLWAQQSTKDKKSQLDISGDWSSLDLASLMKLAQQNLPLKGKIDGETELTIDPTMIQQPSGKIKIKAGAIELPNSQIPTPIGPLDLPAIKLSELQIYGNLKDRVLNLDSSSFGTSKDELSGKIDGTLGLQFDNFGGHVQPRLTNYELRLDMRVKDRLAREQTVGFALTFLEKCKQKGDGGTLAFRCRIAGNAFGGAAQISTF